MALARTSHLAASATAVADKLAPRRRRVAVGGAAVAPQAEGASATATAGVLAGLRPAALELPLASAVPVGRLRRCTFRRLDLLAQGGRGTDASYMATCLHSGLLDAVPLGGLAEASVACSGCTFSGIFRADED